jgi:hypothetical protein
LNVQSVNLGFGATISRSVSTLSVPTEMIVMRPSIECSAVNRYPGQWMLSRKSP